MILTIHRSSDITTLDNNDGTNFMLMFIITVSAKQNIFFVVIGQSLKNCVVTEISDFCLK